MALSHINGVALADLSEVMGKSSISAINGISATLGGGGGGGSPAFVDGLTVALGINGGTTASITSNSGDLVVVGIADYVDDVVSVLTDSKSTSWTLVDTETVPGAVRTRMYYGFAGSIGGHTFTLTGTGVYAAIGVRVFSDLTAIDQVAAGAGSGSDSIQAGSITPSTTDTFVVQVVGLGGSTTPSIDESYISDSANYGGGANMGIAMAYKSFPTASPTNPNWTVAGSTCAAVAASFKP